MLELRDANGTEIVRRDPNQELPLDLLDWTRWIVPEYETCVGGGGFGDAWLGEWTGAAKSHKHIPKVVTKVMRVDKVSHKKAAKRYKVRYI